MVVATVVVAERSEVLRRAVCTLLSYEPQIEVVGEVADFENLIRVARHCKPQIIVMDLHILRDAPADFRSQIPVDISRLLATSLAYDRNAKLLAVSIGATALLDKTTLADELIPTIKSLTGPSARTETQL